MKLRQLAFTLHRYIGVMLGVLLVIVSLTGSALVFWHEIDHARNPQLMEVVPQGQRKSLESIANTARSSYPNLQLSFIELPRQRETTYKMWMTSKDNQRINVYVHPYTGEVLGSRQWGRTLMTFIYDIHMNLLAGKFGEFVVGSCGILLLLLGITGLILWPGWRRVTTGFHIRWQSPLPLINYDIHKVGGVVSSGFLILIACTGAAMIFHSQFEGAVYSLLGTPKPEKPKSTIVANRSPIALDAVLQKADAALPGGETTYLTLPTAPDESFNVTKKFPDEITPSGSSEIYLDQYTGEVLRVDEPFKAPLATKIVNALFPLHIGAYGGLGMRIVHLFIGLALAVLAVTGFVLWWSKTYGAKSDRRRVKL